MYIAKIYGNVVFLTSKWRSFKYLPCVYVSERTRVNASSAI